MIKKFLGFLKQYIRFIQKKDIIMMLTLGILTIIISIFIPALIAKIITNMLNGNYKIVVIVLVLLAIFQISRLGINILNSKVFYKIRKDLLLNIKRQISTSILNINIKTFDENRKGKFIQRLNKDPDTITDCLANIKKHLILLCTNIGIIIYIIYLNPTLGIMYTMSFIIVLYIRSKGVKLKNDYRQKYYNEEEKTTSIWSEILNGIKEVKLLDLKKKFSKQSDNHFENIEEFHYKSDFYFEIYVKLTTIIQWITNAAVILVSIYLIKRQLMGADTFITIFMYRTNIFSFADNFTDLLDVVSNFNLVSSRIYEVIDLYRPVKDESINEDVCKGKIQFKNVCFKYNKKEILKDLNIDIEPNELIVITGKSGEGKTTILNLLTGLYNLNSGEILIDNINITNLSEAYLRKNISVISQNFYIFDMSIKENLRLAKEDATDEQIQSICKKVGIHEFIMNLPEKYDTNIGEGGFLLSGGQRQRIAIARTLLKNTKIILCDEITSSLDHNLEENIIELLGELKKQHTIIFITHRPDLIKKGDKKYLLENGKIREY